MPRGPGVKRKVRRRHRADMGSVMRALATTIQMRTFQMQTQKAGGPDSQPSGGQHAGGHLGRVGDERGQNTRRPKPAMHSAKPGNLRGVGGGPHHLAPAAVDLQIQKAGGKDAPRKRGQMGPLRHAVSKSRDATLFDQKHGIWLQRGAVKDSCTGKGLDHGKVSRASKSAPSRADPAAGRWGQSVIRAA